MQARVSKVVEDAVTASGGAVGAAHAFISNSPVSHFADVAIQSMIGAVIAYGFKKLIDFAADVVSKPNKKENE